MQTVLQTQAQRSGLKSVPDQQVNKTYTPVKHAEGSADFSSPNAATLFQEMSRSLVYAEYSIDSV